MLAAYNGSSLSTSMARLQNRAKEASVRLENKAAVTPKQMFLPGFKIGAMPNHLNRSSLIAPIASCHERKFHRRTVMFTRRDCVLEYTGEQLDEADGDLIMALIAFAQPHPMGTTVLMNRAELLRKIGRNNGKTQYFWLHRRIKALTEATLFLEAKKTDGSTKYRIGKTVAFHISTFEYSDETKSYCYCMDPRWVKMFSNREYALIDWDKRLKIARGQNMAKTLQRLVATTSNSPQEYAIDHLKEKMEYSGRLRDFKEAVSRAVKELERLEIVARGRIEISTKGKLQLVLWLSKSSA